MIQYSDLNNDEKRTLREHLGVERVSAFYLEDNHLLLMDVKELFEYIYLDDIYKLKDAMEVIDRIKDTVISDNYTNKTVQEMLVESNSKVTKISNEVYLYKDSNY